MSDDEAKPLDQQINLVVAAQVCAPRCRGQLDVGVVVGARLKNMPTALSGVGLV